MRINHASSITPRDQLADTFQRLGAHIGSTFVDGGIHPRFGTRNFILPLQSGHYLEDVCPLDHPSTGGKAIAKFVKVEIAGDESRIEEWLGSGLRAAIDSDVEVEWVAVAASEGESGILAVHVMTPSGVVRLDYTNRTIVWRIEILQIKFSKTVYKIKIKLKEGKGR